MRRSWKFRLDPTVAQERSMKAALGLCCELYNACLQERRDAWRIAKKSIGLSVQQGQLPVIKVDRPDLRDVDAQALQDVCRRVDRAFRAFFRRVKTGQKPGYPRFHSHRRYNSFTYPQAYASNKMRADRVFLPKIGWVGWKPWKVLTDLGDPKTLTVKREADGWYAVLSCVVPTPTPLPTTGNAVGIDLGLTNLVAVSDGAMFGNLTPLKRAERHLRIAQRKVSRRVKGSNRRRKAVTILARRHQHLARVRKHQLDGITKRLVTKNDTICIEDLNVIALTGAGANNAQGKGLRRNIHHAAWGMIRWMLTYKAESAGRQLTVVPPAGTSIDCSGCGRRVLKALSERTHRCGCGLVLDRDVNAARNILQRGLQLLRRGDDASRSPRRPEKIGEATQAA